MTHKLIRSIKTRVHKKRLLVIVEFDNNEVAFISANRIKQNTTLEVNEIELLIGSTVRLDFYKKSEIMYNGEVCVKDNAVVKEYFFELQKPVDRLRIENINQLLSFKEIVDIFYFHKYNKENAGIKTKNGEVTFLTLKRLEMQSQLKKSEQHILIGSFIMPEYCHKGETFSDGTIVQKDNVLKGLNLRFKDNKEGMRQNFENNLSYDDDESYEDDSDNGPGSYGYSSWDEMTFYETFEGNIRNYWNID